MTSHSFTDKLPSLRWSVRLLKSIQQDEQKSEDMEPQKEIVACGGIRRRRVTESLPVGWRRSGCSCHLQSQEAERNFARIRGLCKKVTVLLSSGKFPIIAQSCMKPFHCLGKSGRDSLRTRHFPNQSQVTVVCRATGPLLPPSTLHSHNTCNPASTPSSVPCGVCTKG